MTEVVSRGGKGGGGGGYSGFQVTGMIEWGQKSKPPKNPYGFKQNRKRSLDQNLTPKKSNAEFQSHKNFQNALNDILRIFKLFWKLQKIPT